MNYKTMLLASAAVLFASQAMAAQDITGAFAVPGKGQISSDTSIGMTRSKTKFSSPVRSQSFTGDTLYAQEQIEYGITDQFSINAGITNEFDKDYSDMFSYMRHLNGATNETYNNDHNFQYNIGAKYNTRKDDVLFQVAVDYTTWDLHDYYGHHSGTGNKWQKNLGLDLKAGLDMGNGLTPYIIYHIDSMIDDNHRPLAQSVSAGIHKFTGKWALDGAVRYEWTKNYSSIVWENDFLGKGYFGNKTETWLDASADYYLKDNIVIGAYGSYLIDSHDRDFQFNGNKIPGNKYHQSTTYELGLHVKFLF